MNGAQVGSRTVGQLLDTLQNWPERRLSAHVRVTGQTLWNGRVAALRTIPGLGEMTIF